MKAIGVDIGTAFIASAQYEKSNIKAKYVRDGFFKMDYLPQKEVMLKSSKVPFIVRDRPNVPGKKDIYVIGNEAFDIAVLFSEELRRPLKSGVISAQEKETEFILKEIIRRVAGEGSPGDIAYYSVPGEPVDKDFNVIYHKEMFRRFLKQAGYDAKPLNEAMALVYAELESTDFSGLAISLGAGMANVAMSYKGLEIFSFSVARCGDWIDENVAKTRGIPTSDAAAEKEKEENKERGTKALDLLNPVDDVEEAIAIYYQAMLDYVIDHVVKATEQHQRKIKLTEPLSFVVGGGTTMPKGFLEMLANTVRSNPLPIKVGKVWQAKNPVMAVCKGCLIAAQKDLGREENDGVTDVSGGKNEKHQYPVAPKEVPVEEKKPRSQKQKRDDVEKSRVMHQGGGMEESISIDI